MITWMGDEPPQQGPIGPLGWILVGLRGAGCVVTVYTGLMFLRLFQWTRQDRLAQAVPRITFRWVLRVIGLGVRVTGRPMAHPGGVVANHAGWIDILTLRACQDVTFVSKDDVASWPGIGALARSVNTIFIRRDPKLAAVQQAQLAERISGGDRILIFPEGTSTDGQRVLPFKSTLFQTFFNKDLPDVWVQPVSVVYTAPTGRDARFYGWWANMEFGAHLLRVLASARQGSVEVIFHDPLRVSDFTSRKDLSATAEDAVRRGMDQALSR